MGYQRKTYVLRWPEGHDLHGLEVVAKGLPMRKLMELAPMADTLTSGQATAFEKVQAAGTVCSVFASRLVEWNLEDDGGQPVPATLEGVEDQDLDLTLGIVMAWMGAAASVDIPLPQPSPPGGTSETEPDTAASIPVETLSPSPLS